MTDPTHEYVVIGHGYDGMDVYGCTCGHRAGGNPDPDERVHGYREITVPEGVEIGGYPLGREPRV